MKKLWILGLFLVAGAGTAAAQEPATGVGISHEQAAEAAGQIETFAAIDRDADGFLQWEEVRNAIVRVFHDADRDGDGAIAAGEFAVNEAHRQRADMNGDGKTTQRELVAYAAAVFGAADTDNDEKLSPEEAGAIVKKEEIK